MQSVALRLICEREQEICVFKPEEFWTITIRVKGQPDDDFQARLTKIREGKSDKLVKASIDNETDAATHVDKIKNSDLVISDLTKRKTKKHAPPPFITSTMQQAAARLLRYSTSRIMRSDSSLMM